ncbi:rho guanine nucleotide exchange factor 7 isoform X3 [Octopus sinensis]|uniref:Rho guanine nucleotide exchange factor 7 isoform X3 n=1 Tax=Octopus sinensis TaxID=2607531 RepID=A0A7E6EQ20_9MOLL|nr:rho guanine nucleotide exchange factor 7 isoform X3 [Octopus sinensis]
MADHVGINTGTSNPKRVKAMHNFKGSNNDELVFQKGDLITVTQVVDGGWWEGTLNGKTGWFPSNYVKEYKPDPVSSPPKLTPPDVKSTLENNRENTNFYHNVVLENVVETEEKHVGEMRTLLQKYIRPLRNNNVLTQAEFSQLTGNLEEIFAFQQKFLSSLEEVNTLPSVQRRMGGVFMEHASTLKELYLVYCSNHPSAVAILQAKWEELNKFMEYLGAPVPGAMTLTTNLSKPFTRLDKYPSLLRELETHIEECHVDRGDTQRAIAVYRDISNSCTEVRKRKEMEYEIIHSSIKGWEGEEITQLGEVVYLSQVKLITLTGEKLDRVFVLFQNVLVMLSLGPRLSGYHYEGQLKLSGLSVNKSEVENMPNSYEITGNLIDKLTVLCTTRNELNHWVEMLCQQIKNSQTNRLKPQSLQLLELKALAPDSDKISSSQPSISMLTQAKTAKMTQPPLQTKMYKTWSMSCLRPAPPMRPSASERDALKSPRSGRKPGMRRKPEIKKKAIMEDLKRSHSEDEYDYRWKRYDPVKSEDDQIILRVIEAYCTSAKTRQTVNSCLKKNIQEMVAPIQRNNKLRLCPVTDIKVPAAIYSPHVLIAEEEKIIDDVDGEEFVFKEKGLVDTVYTLKDHLKELSLEQKKLRKDLDEEVKARKKLESILPVTLKNAGHTTTWEENMT